MLRLLEKIYATLEELQSDMDEWLEEYNSERTHTSKYCYDRTPMQTFVESLPLAKERCRMSCHHSLSFNPNPFDY